jgi:carbonic anhydrase/acetyltransferase-like protein (isoleucine patch superfamily)
LGNDVLQSWIERIRKLGLHNLWLTSSHGSDSKALSLPWLAEQGLERLLMIKLKSYAEIDLADLLRFHCERRNSMTEAHDARGQLGVCLLDHRELRGGAEEFCYAGASPDRTAEGAYQFRGYAKRILSASERQELVRDGLSGACAMRPIGAELREQVWIGAGTQLADSVRVIGPAYIGARTMVRAGATIGPFASVERDCVVDCGTTVQQSTVLPNTYLAPGLLIRQGLVDGRYLKDLARGAVADLQPAGLGGRVHRRDSRNHAFRDNKASSRVDNGSKWGLVPYPTTPQPWLQVWL